MNKNALPQTTVQSNQLLAQLYGGQVFQVDPKREGAMIICKRHHAELAGPGAAIGGFFDIDCTRIVPIGDVSVIYPQTYQERQQSFIIRQRWCRAVQQVTAELTALKRAKIIVTLLAQSFSPEAIAPVPDEVLAQLVGVLPKTMKIARYPASPQPRYSQKPVESYCR